MLDTNFNPDYLAKIAKICHQANKAWCEANGDFSQKNWEEAEDWQKDSAIKGVAFRINNPDSGDDAQHNSWMKEKIDDGWVYGEVKDAEAKTHPCIVPFEELPVVQRKKDTLFCAIVDSLSKEKLEYKRDIDFNGLLRVGKGTFGMAVEAAKHGLKVSRKGWNGQNMFAYIVPAAKYPAQTGVAKEYFGENSMVPYRTYWALKTAQEDVACWSPSGSDSLAEDWFIYGTSENSTK